MNMKKIVTLFGVGALSLSLGCAKVEKQAPVKVKNTEYVSGEVLVQTQADLLTNKSITSQYEVISVDSETGVYLLKSSRIAGSEKAAISELENTGLFSIIEPNYRVSIDAQIPRDPKWLELWALENYGQDSPAGIAGSKDADIRAKAAWDVTKGSRKVVVAVIDTGIDYTHPDLRRNMWVNQAEKNGTPGVDDDGNGYADDIYGWNFISSAQTAPYHGQLGSPDPMDDHGHGTHCAGTIGADGNNNIGITGVNWEVSLMALKFLSAGGSGNSMDQYRAIRYAIKNKVDIISASYGGGAPSKLLEQAITDAGKAGILFVAAAGNDSANNDFQKQYPANYDVDTILAVAATDNRDQIASFSNFGAKSVHISAPGVAITSTFPVALAADSADKSPYRSWNGTSMATPHVAGAAALVLAADPSLKGNPVALKKRLMSSVDYRPQLAGRVVSGGRLNLEMAVKGKTGNTPFGQGQWVEEKFQLETPRYPTERIDQAWTIHKKGAQAIQLHIQSGVIDTEFDSALLYDRLHRPIMKLPALISNYWTPAIRGDKVHLKFSNSIVQLQKYLGPKKVKDPEEIPIEQRSICYISGGDSMWTCETFDKPSKPFANFTSDGIVIDKIRYIPATPVNPAP